MRDFLKKWHLNRSNSARLPQKMEVDSSKPKKFLTSNHIWWRCLLHGASHAKFIFADPLQTSHACHRFWNCCKIHTFGSLFARCGIHYACHIKRCLNVQKWSKMSEQVVFIPFWLRVVVLATAECTFSTAPLPNVLGGAFSILTSNCASLPQPRAIFDVLSRQMAPTRRFSKPNFQPFRATEHWKNTVVRLFYLLARFDLLSTDSLCSDSLFSDSLCSDSLSFDSLFSDSFSSDSFSSLTLLTTAAASVHTSEVWLLNFLRLILILNVTFDMCIQIKHVERCGASMFPMHAWNPQIIAGDLQIGFTQTIPWGGIHPG